MATPAQIAPTRVTIKAHIADKATACVAQATAHAADGPRDPYRGPVFVSGARRAVGFALKLYKAGQPITTTTILRDAIFLRDYRSDPAGLAQDRESIEEVLLGLTSWLAANAVEILGVGDEITDEMPFRVANGPRMRLAARPDVVMRVGGRITVLDSVIGRPLACEARLARSPRLYIYSHLAARCWKTPREAVDSGQWLPSTGQMAFSGSGPGDIDYIRGIVGQLASALAGLKPAPERLNPSCLWCSCRAECGAWRALRDAGTQEL